MHTFRSAVLLTMLFGAVAAQAQHDGDMLIASTMPAGGALAIRYDFSQNVLVTESASGGGNTLYTGTDPGWDALVDAAGGFFPLPAGLPVSVQITAIDPGASLKIGATTLSAVGHSRLLGTTPTVHVHPIWQLVAPTGVSAARTVSFRLTTTAGYASSVAYAATLSNVASTTSTSTTTTSTSMPPVSDELRTGKKLLLKAKAGEPSKRSLLLLSADPLLAIGTGRDDPTIHGGTMRIVSAAAGVDVTFVLPAPHWTLVGKLGDGKGYKYADKAGDAGPIKAVLIKPAKTLKVTAAGAALPHLLASDPQPVAGVVTLGDRRYCFAFGGVVTFNAGKQWKAERAPAPEACAP